jgi:ubiquinone/menaquinone biosynthesis C-methylase UbiE
MDKLDTGQVTGTAAEVYDAFFVPALFAAWAPRTCDAAGIAAGRRALDVACGTGVVAREAARRGAEVAGLDRNAGMLAVARRLEPGIEWREGMAEKIPFDDGRFDAVTCQFGLMFFEDRAQALGEMMRVLRPGGRLVATVWDSLERTPGYRAMAALLQRLFGDETAALLHAPFVLGEAAELRELLESAGIPNPAIETRPGDARFPSIEAWVRTDVKGWTLADAIDDAQYAKLQKAALQELRQFTQADGSVRFDSPAHVITAVKG